MVTIDVGERNHPVPLIPSSPEDASFSWSSKYRVTLAVE
jgi:hypothetical protein